MKNVVLVRMVKSVASISVVTLLQLSKIVSCYCCCLFSRFFFFVLNMELNCETRNNPKAMLTSEKWQRITIVVNTEAGTMVTYVGGQMCATVSRTDVSFHVTG